MTGAGGESDDISFCSGNSIVFEVSNNNVDGFKNNNISVSGGDEGTANNDVTGIIVGNTATNSLGNPGGTNLGGTGINVSGGSGTGHFVHDIIVSGNTVRGNPRRGIIVSGGGSGSDNSEVTRVTVSSNERGLCRAGTQGGGENRSIDDCERQACRCERTEVALSRQRNHELRTPLSSIIGYARLLRRGSEGQLSALQQENLADLLRNAERLLGLIDSLLDFAKIEAGKMDAHIEPVKVEELIQTVVTTIEPMLDRNSIRLVRDVPPGMAPLFTDPEKLRQILLNLLGNAVKFTDAGEIRISACQENGHFKLAVADTGIGIDKADLGRIFEEFDRGRLTGAGGYRGTGLGLAIVKRLVDFLRGTVTVESEVGRGSIFMVTLPATIQRPLQSRVDAAGA